MSEGEKNNEKLLFLASKARWREKRAKTFLSYRHLTHSLSTKILFLDFPLYDCVLFCDVIVYFYPPINCPP